MKFKTKSGKIAKRYINSKEATQVFDERAIKTALETKALELSRDEMIKLQEERLRELSNPIVVEESIPKKEEEQKTRKDSSQQENLN